MQNRSSKYPDGVKHDSGKARYDLIPHEAMAALAQVMTHGAQKYDDNSWQNLFKTDGKARYTAALIRHIEAWRSGEINDQESGIHHLGHALANLAFLIWNDRQEERMDTGELPTTDFDGMEASYYLAGPMRGLPNYNFDTFAAVARRLRHLGLSIVSPHEKDLQAGFDPGREHTEEEMKEFLADAFAWDVRAVLACWGIVLLPGWEHSQGARTEAKIALFCNKELLAWNPVAKDIRELSEVERKQILYTPPKK